MRAGATEETFRVTAIEPEFMQMRELTMGSGRYITDHDMETAAAVVVLGSTRARQLFGTADPVGKALNIDGKAYTVIGVTAEKVFFWQRTDDYNAHEWLNRLVTVPITSYMKRHQEAGAERIDELNLRLHSPEVHKESREALEILLVPGTGSRISGSGTARNDSSRAPRRTWSTTSPSWPAASSLCLWAGS